MTGVVTSNKMTNALIVTVFSIQVHTKYNKRFKTKKKYAVACKDATQFEIGQKVTIESCKPVSKTIRFKVID
jgi:ribosomal protein S17